MKRSREMVMLEMRMLIGMETRTQRTQRCLEMNDNEPLRNFRYIEKLDCTWKI